MLLTLLCTFALAGYGDPVDGLPSYAERDLHHWTNAARVAPETFTDHYAVGECSVDDFSADERTPQRPLAWNPDLARAARDHSQDMADNGFFDHDSSDGTETSERVARYYDSGRIGENISDGYPHEESTVLEGWMCSTAGHRENIMEADFNELGVGVVGELRTQVFGGRAELTRPSIAMGVHEPALPTLSAEFFADWTGAPPADFVVYVNGEPLDMSLEYGAAEQGIYRAVLADLPEDSCVVYHFEADGVSWPETGSYGWGDCNWSDADAQWLAEQRTPDGVVRTGDSGCTTSGGPVGWGWLLAGPLLVWRRRS